MDPKKPDKFDPQDYIRQHPHPTEEDIDMWEKATSYMIEHENWRPNSESNKGNKGGMDKK